MAVHFPGACGKGGGTFDAAALVIRKFDDGIGCFSVCDREYGHNRRLSEKGAENEFTVEQLFKRFFRAHCCEAECGNILQSFAVHEFFELDETAFLSPREEFCDRAVCKFEFRARADEIGSGCRERAVGFDGILVAKPLESFVHFFDFHLILLVRDDSAFL